MRRTVTAVIGLATGTISSVAVHRFLYANLNLVLVLGAVYALAAWLVLRRWSVFTTRRSLWGGLFGGILAGVPIFGIQPIPYLSSEAATALGLLTIGFGVAMAGIGVELAFTATSRTEERVREPTDIVAD